jgi:hypothetical protein
MKAPGLFWSVERQKREDQRRGRRRERARRHAWLHPSLWWISRLSFIAAAGIALASSRHDPARLAAFCLLAVSLIGQTANDLVVWRKRAHGWEPTEGVHFPPAVKPDQPPIIAWWRWTTRSWNAQA